MIKELERIRLGEREFFIDDRLEGFRNVNNPNDRFTLTELIDTLNAFNVAKVLRGRGD